MKKIVLCLFLVITNILFIYGNNQNYLVVSLKEKFSIQDNPGLFYFKFPRYLVVDKKGYICVKDHDQLLLFSPEGEFIKNIFKKGEGPGEMLDICGIYPEQEKIIAFTRAPSKLLKFNYSGKFESESSILLNLNKANFLTFYNNRFYFFIESYRNIGGETTLNTKVELFSIDEEGQNYRDENMYFNKKYYLSRNIVLNINFVQIARKNNHSFYIANSGNYEVKYLDLQKKELSTLIRKDYKNVKIKKSWREILNPGQPPRLYIRKIIDDIQRIWIYNDKIWLLTSTFIEKKNLIKVDVYSSKGKYEGSFYLRMSNNIHPFMLSYIPMTFFNGLLYICEETKESISRLVCYKLENIPSWAS